jgi:dTDP-4-amino-4,6-dideoxygalactose transaminase
MCAILLKVGPEDEILMPSYTFVSTANAFILRGAQIRFIDSGKDSPNIDPEALEAAIGPRTKVIVVVHYAGIACDMTQIMKIAKKHNLFVVEDAAHAVESYHQDQRLGTFGDLSTFSFHETKNIYLWRRGVACYQ